MTTNATVNEVLDESAKMKRLMKELEELRVKQKTLATDGAWCECLIKYSSTMIKIILKYFPLESVIVLAPRVLLRLSRRKMSC